jgi:hypothetical protein
LNKKSKQLSFQPFIKLSIGSIQLNTVIYELKDTSLNKIELFIPQKFSLKKTKNKRHLVKFRNVQQMKFLHFKWSHTFPPQNLDKPLEKVLHLCTAYHQLAGLALVPQLDMILGTWPLKEIKSSNPETLINIIKKV